ncbi:MAG: hypothetical protein WD872_00450 [Pirellulaceae bacterium]
MVSGLKNSILDAILDPLADCFTPEVARRIVSVSIDPARQAQINRLAAKANEGLLSDAERAEYEEFIEAMDLLAIVKAKAQLILAVRDR